MLNELVEWVIWKVGLLIRTKNQYKDKIHPKNESDEKESVCGELGSIMVVLTEVVVTLVSSLNVENFLDND